jgi:hypothetical protein
VVHVPDGPDVHVRLRTIKFFLRHFSFIPCASPFEAAELVKKIAQTRKPVPSLLRYSLNLRNHFLRDTLRRLIVALEVHR